MKVLTVFLSGILAAGGGEPLARVGEVTITADVLGRRMDETRAAGKRATPDQVLASLVDEALLAAEGRRLGLAGAADVTARVEALTRRAAAEVFLEKQVSARYDPDEAALREMFHASADFVVFESATYETVEAASAALSRIRAGAAFEAEARSAVVAQLHPNRATAPSSMRAQLEPALAAALFAAAPGALVGPVPMRAGAAIARMIEKEIGTEAQFTARRGALLAYGRKQFVAQTRKQFMTHLRENARVEVDLKFLEGLRGVEASPAQLDHVIATVSGRPIRYRDIHETVLRVAGGTGHIAGASLKIQLAWKEIETRLLEAVAADRGYLEDPEVVARRPEAERAAIAAATVDHLRRTAPPPSEDEIKAFYDRNAAAYGKPFGKVLPDAAARAAAGKRDQAVAQRLAALRKSATVSIDRGALARAASQASAMP